MYIHLSEKIIFVVVVVVIREKIRMKNINMYSRDYKTFLAKDFIEHVSIQNWKYDL